jgi:REP element-mobilizing transposase RayT
MVRGLDRQVIFKDDLDRDDFVKRLVLLVKAGAWSIYAWALLPNHAHLLVRTAHRPLARTMRSLLTGYAGAFNRRHKRTGHLFQNRYKSVVVEEDPYFLELVRYIHLNPLRAGVVSDLRALAKYRYCGHGPLAIKTPLEWQGTTAVLHCFAGQIPRARALYREFVAEGAPLGKRPELGGGGLIRSAGGWKAVAALRRGREGYLGDERILGDSDFVQFVRDEMQRADEARALPGWSTLTVTDLMERVCDAEGFTVARLLGAGRARPKSRVRRGIAYLWVEVLGRSGRALAHELRLRPESIYYAAKQGQKDAAYWQSLLKK